jgi:KDO2-lipid IV(A) lauroyltransferase
MKSRWKLFRYRLEEAAVRGLAGIIPRLPRPIAVHLGRGAGALAAQVDRHGRNVALTNLEAAFGEKYSRAQREEIARESYQQFASTMMDLFWSPRLNSENFRHVIEFDGLEHWNNERAQNRPVIFASCHYGNFEMLSLCAGWIGIKTQIITQEFKNARLDPVFNFLRTRSGHEIAPRDGGIVRLYKALRRGNSVTILIDLALQLHQPAVAIDCFGLQTPVTFAHAWLAARTGAAIIPVHAQPLPGGRSRVIFHPKIEVPPDATQQEIAQLCWDRFEPIVRQNPAPWLWMYKYWRYRPEKAAKSYPDYAQANPRFDRLIAENSKEKSRANSAPPGLPNEPRD